VTQTLIPIHTGRKSPYMLEITRHDACITRLPTALHGATLVHITDFHGGFGNTEPVFEEAIARVNALKPDLILFTGDYINDTNRNDFPIHEILGRFEARLGAYGSFGNHDHRRGIVATRRAVERGGVRVLHNENVCIADGLWLAGVDDYYEGKPDLPRTLAGIPEDVTPIVLSHNPTFIEKIDRDLFMLSGHTHGGQIVLPLLSARLIVKLHLHCNQVAGWYHYGRSHIYVNRGIGVTGKPFRYNCPAEIAVFRLLRGAGAKE